MFAEGTQRPLEPKVILVLVFILNEVFILFIDRVVSKVHKLVIFIDF